MHFAGDLTPTEAAAFWRLNLLNSDDLSRLSMRWIELGLQSDNVGALAAERVLTVREHGPWFEKALGELGADAPASDEAAAWIVIRALLRAIVDGAVAPLAGASDVIHGIPYGTALFPLRNLAGDGKAFVGEELGIEKLWGLYYSHDEWGVDQDELARDIRLEAKRVLDEFYTHSPGAGAS